jgi:cutinase
MIGIYLHSPPSETAMEARRWFVFSIPFLVSLFMFGTTGSAPTANAEPSALSAPASFCPAAEIIGVHGTGEGPGPDGKPLSPEIKATFAAFTADERTLGEHSARLEYYPYPALGLTDYLPAGWPTVLETVSGYADHLEAELKEFSRACPRTPVSLIGYSLGALLVNGMLSAYRDEWNHIKAVELYGDPCWYNPHGGYRGLARYAAAAGIRLGCFPPDAYPYPRESPAGFPFVTQSLCNHTDPVCGQGWPPYAIGAQLAAAALCPLDRCPHLSYVGTAASEGAKFLAENAFRRAGGDG